jgi:hypothetical protein
MPERTRAPALDVTAQASLRAESRPVDSAYFMISK